jgi:hypothetical protein
MKEHVGIQLQRKGFSSPTMWLFEFLARCSNEEATTHLLAIVGCKEQAVQARRGNIDPSSVARK